MSDDVRQYDYPLPSELIAQQPVACRSDARLMIVHRADGLIEHAHVRDLPEWLPAGDCLVVNDSRVVPARLDGYRLSTRGRWQGLFLSADGHGNWQLLCKTRGKLSAGERIMLRDRTAADTVVLRLLARLDAGAWAARAEADEPTWSLLQRIGRVPLPHYIRHGEMIDDDLTWYQTVYADRWGSVAAPTAGLHFTPALIDRLRLANVELQRITLHVGVGTFRPISAPDLQRHTMLSEWGEVTEETAERLRETRQQGGRVVAVGTTSVRVLESAAASGPLRAWSGQTDLFIRPPYQFRAVDALLTNFHLPRSTLLVLVRTFGGDTLIRSAYEIAVAERYRFFSYGDAMLIL
jgi:S-adenosylmethionine:tRNA ribosyltransferase-isomerase